MFGLGYHAVISSLLFVSKVGQFRDFFHKTHYKIRTTYFFLKCGFHEVEKTAYIQNELSLSGEMQKLTCFLDFSQ